MAELGDVRRQPAGGVRLRGAEQRRLRAHHAGAGARRFRRPLLRLRAGRALHVPDLRLRQRGAEAEVPPADGRGRGDRLLRAHRAGLRLQPRRDDHPRARRPTTAGCSTAPRCGSPTAPPPTSPSSGPRRAIWTTSSSIRGFIVPTDTPGFRRRGSEGQALAAGVATPASSSLQDVRVGEDALLPESGGLKSPLMCLTQARYGIAWGAVGAAMACYDEALSYAKERVQFDGSRSPPRRSSRRGWRRCSPRSPRRSFSACSSGRLKDEGRMRPQQVSLAKRNNVHMAAEIAREARRLLGANGILVEYSAMRHMANLESRLHLRGHARHPWPDPRAGCDGARGVLREGTGCSLFVVRRSLAYSVERRSGRRADTVERLDPAGRTTNNEQRKPRPSA